LLPPPPDSPSFSSYPDGDDGFWAPYIKERNNRLQELSRRTGVDFAVFGLNESGTTVNLVSATSIQPLMDESFWNRLSSYHPPELPGTGTKDERAAWERRVAERQRQASESLKPIVSDLIAKRQRPLILLSDHVDLVGHGEVENWAIEQLAQAIRHQSEGLVPVFHDNIPERAVENWQHRPTVTGPNNVAVYHDSSLETYGVDREIIDQARGANFHIARTGEVVKEGNLIIVTAHKNSDYRNYLMELARNGVLRGKVLLLYSCFTLTDPDFINELLSRSGAHAVVRFTKAVYPADAAGLIRKLGQVVGASHTQPFYLEDALRLAVDLLLDESSPSEKMERERLRNFVIQL
jgi:hypothetical protein